MTWGCCPPKRREKERGEKERGEKERGAIIQPVLVTFPGSTLFEALQERALLVSSHERGKEGGRKPKESSHFSNNDTEKHFCSTKLD